MTARDRQAATTEGDADHQLLLSYLSSAAWEARLAEARSRRQAIVDGLDDGTMRRESRIRPTERTRPRPPAPRLVDAPSEAVAPPRLFRPVDRPVRTAPVPRRTYALPVAAIFVVALLAGASTLLRDGGATDAVGTAGNGQNAVPVDVVTRGESGIPSEVAAAKPGRAAALPRSGVEMLAASLREMASSNNVTVVASARQAEALASLDRAKGAASVRVTPFELDRSTVSYYHSGDADAAEWLAARLDGETMDLTGILPTPPDGALSVHLAAN